MISELKNGSISLSEIEKMTGGRLVCAGISDAEIDRICTDSREASEGTLFAAIRGERTDGHLYIPRALENGCRAILAEKMPEGADGFDFAAVLAEDTVEALGKIAEEYKKKNPCFTVGVTGSVGKTTTKEFIAAVLGRKFMTYRTEGNHNSVIGLPLSIMEIPAGCGAAVLEMGMSGFGEISSMTRAARPDVAVITNIGTSHMEMLGSRENICRAKMEIAEGLSEDGILLLNGDEPLLRGADKGGRKALYVSLENRDADFRALKIRVEVKKTTFDLLWNGRVYSNIEIPVMGRHNVYAALFAFAVGTLCGMDENEIREGLSDFRSPGMRQNIYDAGGITLIEDCYNASPESMRSAINVLSELSEHKNGARTAALLGDMLELGESSEKLHREVGEYLARSGCRLLFAYGPMAEKIAESAVENGMSPENVYVNRTKGTPEKTGELMLHALREGDILLVKASRGMEAEKVIEYLKKHLSKIGK